MKATVRLWSEHGEIVRKRSQHACGSGNADPVFHYAFNAFSTRNTGRLSQRIAHCGIVLLRCCPTVKHPRRWLLIGSITTATVGVIVLVLTTPLVSNAVLLLMERSNFIPRESSIFTFEPYAINQGSSNYWLYGKDRTYYYHFTYEDDAPYVYIPQDNRCPGFHRQDARTWCSALPGKAR